MVAVSSEAHRIGSIDLEDLHYKHGRRYWSWLSYGASSLSEPAVHGASGCCSSAALLQLCHMDARLFRPAGHDGALWCADALLVRMQASRS